MEIFSDFSREIRKNEQFWMENCCDRTMMQALVVFGFAVFGLATGDTGLRRSEDSEATICGTFDVCNIVHSHYWGPTDVEKICKCPNDTLCPATFDHNDNRSLPVNVRTQMKFCRPIAELKFQLTDCGEDDDAISVHTMYYVNEVKNVSANLACNCRHKQPIYWRFHSRVGKAVENDEKLFMVIDNFQCTGEGKKNANFEPTVSLCQSRFTWETSNLSQRNLKIR